MKTIRNMLAGLIVAVFGLAGAVRADDTKQTEPVKTAPVKAGKKYTAEDLMEVFENIGFTVKPVHDKDCTLVQLNLEIEQSGWSFRPTVRWNKEQTYFLLTAAIVTVDGSGAISGEMCKQLMRLNGDFFPGSLCYQEYSDGYKQINLYMMIDNVDLKPATFRTKLTAFCDMIKIAVETREKAAKAEAVKKADVDAKLDPMQPLVP